MNFSEEQQAHVDSLIKKKYAEAHVKAEAKAAEQLSTAEARHVEETQTLKVELERLKASQGESNNRLKSALLKAEIAQTRAVRIDQVMKLLDGDFTLGVDGALKVVDEKGVTRLDASGAPLSVKSYLEGFLEDNPHLRRASGTAGAGSTSAMFNPFSATAGAMQRRDFDGLSTQAKLNFIQSGGSITD